MILNVALLNKYICIFINAILREVSQIEFLKIDLTNLHSVDDNMLYIRERDMIYGFKMYAELHFHGLKSNWTNEFCIISA